MPTQPHGPGALIGLAFAAGQSAPERDRPNVIANYVKTHASDRRYSLTFLAASTSFRSAIVQYRGHRYYVDHHYPTDSWRVTHA
jgi:hypothetical protein